MIFCYRLMKEELKFCCPYGEKKNCDQFNCVKFCDRLTNFMILLPQLIDKICDSFSVTDWENLNWDFFSETNWQNSIFFFFLEPIEEIHDFFYVTDWRNLRFFSMNYFKVQDVFFCDRLIKFVIPPSPHTHMLDEVCDSLPQSIDEINVFLQWATGETQIFFVQPIEEVSDSFSHNILMKFPFFSCDWFLKFSNLSVFCI